MKIANDHAKKWFTEIKRLLEKEDNYFLDPVLDFTMAEAKSAANSEKNKPCTLIKQMYNKQIKKKWPQE